MRNCLFCPNPANSREDIWPKWILQRLRIKGPIRAEIAKTKSFVMWGPKAAHKSKCVCKTCNNGWMSALEDVNIPLLGCLLRDIAMPLDRSQQEVIATWVIKTSMVTESTAHPTRQQFYSVAEREQLRTSLSIPARTSVWLGRYSGTGTIAMKGTDAWSGTESPVAVQGYVYTILFGYLVIQSLTLHVEGEYGDTPITIHPKGHGTGCSSTSGLPMAGMSSGRRPLRFATAIRPSTRLLVGTTSE